MFACLPYTTTKYQMAISTFHIPHTPTILSRCDKQWQPLYWQYKKYIFKFPHALSSKALKTLATASNHTKLSSSPRFISSFSLLHTPRLHLRQLVAAGTFNDLVRNRMSTQLKVLFGGGTPKRCIVCAASSAPLRYMAREGRMKTYEIRSILLDSH